MLKGARFPVVTNDNPKNKRWASVVAAAARDAMAGRAMLDGPVFVRLWFQLARPQAHIGRHGVKPGAPHAPAVRPDWDKLARSVSDALEGVVYGNDAQVVQAVVTKEYAERPGVQVEVGPWSW